MRGPTPDTVGRTRSVAGGTVTGTVPVRCGRDDRRAGPRARPTRLSRSDDRLRAISSLATSSRLAAAVSVASHGPRSIDRRLTRRRATATARSPWSCRHYLAPSTRRPPGEISARDQRPASTPARRQPLPRSVLRTALSPRCTIGSSRRQLRRDPPLVTSSRLTPRLAPAADTNTARHGTAVNGRRPVRPPLALHPAAQCSDRRDQPAARSARATTWSARQRSACGSARDAGARAALQSIDSAAARPCQMRTTPPSSPTPTSTTRLDKRTRTGVVDFFEVIVRARRHGASHARRRAGLPVDDTGDNSWPHSRRWSSLHQPTRRRARRASTSKDAHGPRGQPAHSDTPTARTRDQRPTRPSSRRSCECRVAYTVTRDSLDQRSVLIHEYGHSSGCRTHTRQPEDLRRLQPAVVR
jgi:hypothetical protein